MAGYFDDLMPAPAPGPSAPAQARPYGAGSSYSGRVATPAQEAYAAGAGAASGELGSATNPYYDTPDLTGGDGVAHVDLQGNLHLPRVGGGGQGSGAASAAPVPAPPSGAAAASPVPPAAGQAAAPTTPPSGAFDDLVPDRMKPGYWQGIGDQVSRSASKLWDDLSENGSLPADPQGIGDAARQMWRDFTWAPRVAGDLVGLVGSPIEGGIVQPAARLLDKIPVPAYSQPSFSIDGNGIHIRPPQQLTPLETHDANADMIRNILGAIPADPELVGARLGNLSAAAAPAAGSVAASVFTPVQEGAIRFIQDRLPPGVTPETLSAADPRLMAAEVAGPRMAGHLDVMAKRSGDVGDALAEQVERRRSSRPGEILSAAADALGVHPADAASALDKIVAQGQAEARPLYEISNAAGPVWSEKLAKIARTDAGRQAVKYAGQLMSNEMKDPEALGMTFVENPEHWASYTPPPLTAEEPAAVGFAGGLRAPSRAPAQGPSLLKFIADNGGINDSSGDVAAMGGDQWHLGKPYQRRLIGTQQPDDVATRAWEAGYFGGDEPPSVNQLYDTMGHEMRGRALYSRNPDVQALQRWEGANAAEERAYYGGDASDVPHPDQYVGRPQPVSEPAFQHVPNAQTVDYVKRGFDQLIDKHTAPDGTIDKVGQTIVGLKQQWVDEAKRLNPYYGAALDKAGDYLAPKDAAQFGRTSFFLPSTTPKMVAERLAETPAGVRAGMRLGVSENIRKTVGDRNGVNQIISVLGPGAADNRAKLQILLGQRKAQPLLDAIDLQKSMRDVEGGFRNSKTAERTMIQAEQDGSASPQAAMAKGVKNGLRFGPARMLWEGIHAVADHIVDRALTPGLADAQVREGGPMLYNSPQDLAQILRKFQEEHPVATDGQGRPIVRRGGRGMIGASAPLLLQSSADRSQ